jgi:pimeloyl-ACP methyl ester carboxylesterase
MLWGRQDGLVPSVHARAFARAHPDAKVHVLDDCGHYPHIELPQRFNNVLRRWLDETYVASRSASSPSASSRRIRSA